MPKKNNKTYSRTNMRKMACTGCGRHAKYVDEGVTAWFCNHCFTITGNHLRYNKGLDLIKPLENIHVKDHVIGIDGKEYIIVGKDSVIDGDKFYFVKEKGQKEILTVGDFFFVRFA